MESKNLLNEYRIQLAVSQNLTNIKNFNPSVQINGIAEQASLTIFSHDSNLNVAHTANVNIKSLSS